MDDSDNRDRLILNAILPFAKPTAQRNLTEIRIESSSRNSSIVFVLLPEWAINFPPYNVAKLAAVTRAAGFKTQAFDLNIEAFKDFKNWEGLTFDPWGPSWEWKWIGDNYMEHLHEFVRPFIESYVDKILQINPTAVGFTLYYCNEAPTMWMIKEIKRRSPDTCIIVGGPQCHSALKRQDHPYIDYVVSGEGEGLILTVMNEIEANGRPTTQRWVTQDERERINLDLLPAPAYDYFNFNDYRIPNGVTTEISRGCIAKCVFCSETHFWRYRGRQVSKILNDVLTLHDTRGIDVYWFLDSLVNGNLNELRGFCKGIIASGLKIKWTGYARCDGRMDYEYLKDVADSGCTFLSYGIESGSDKVLADMDKGVTIAEMEDNLRNGEIVGIEANCNMIVGFPTETWQDFYETLVFIWRNRNNSITSISPGMGFGLIQDTIAGQNPGKFGISDFNYEGSFITKDYKNSIIHRMVRLLSFEIFLQQLVNKRNINFGFRTVIKDHYKLVFDTPAVTEIEFETFDFDICKTENSFADSIANEFWPLLRLFWRARGAFSFNFKIPATLSNDVFGSRMSANFEADILFTIDANGVWSSNFKMKFIQCSESWYYSAFRDQRSNAITRSNARTGIKLEEIITYTEYDKGVANQQVLNKTVDLSFTYNYTGSGNWSKYD